MKKSISERDIKKGQLLYIIEAVLEYFISIMVAGSFLATLTKELGFSDSLTGILSSIISLGCLFQLLSLTLRKRQVKAFVITMSIINQLLFILLYIIPFFSIKSTYKISLFVVTIILAYAIYNFAHPKKISWLMSLIDDSKRGSFTANKEITSLITGIFFHFSMGAVIDLLIERNQIKIAFLISAAVMLLCAIFHTISMLITVEKEYIPIENGGFLKNIEALAKNKSLIKVTAVFVLYHITVGLTTPFYGTYLIGELDFSLKFVSVITIGSSVVRILVSRFWGKYADKNSFAKMVEKCFLILALSLICATFAVPSNGKTMFALYYIFHGISMGGINSALINLIFDSVAVETRSDSLAICQAVSGLAGFLVTLAASPLVTFIQQNGNKILDLTVYAQQLFSFVGLIFTLLTVLFVRFALIKKKHNK